MKPYALLADIHLHNWSAFAEVNSFGVNTRLAGLLSEIGRAARTVREAGGNRIVIAGDLFHVRGKIAPSVLNPTLDLFGSLVADGFEVIIMPGNHDLEGKDSERLSAAVTALEAVGCKVVHQTEGLGGVQQRMLVLVPWIEHVNDLRAKLKTIPKNMIVDLILHAPIDGVLNGPMGGLSPTELADLGFHNVYAGHYHNHKVFSFTLGPSVVSIGALAHHTWSDVNSKAGFLIVHEHGFDWHKSYLPEFIEMDEDEDEEQFALRVPGNYVRVRVKSTKVALLQEAREWALKLGAKGVVVISVKEPTEAREVGVIVKSGATLETSVADFVRSKFPAENVEKITKEAQVCLAEATEV